jgi:hypothetical protein
MKGNYLNFIDALGKRESGNNYEIVNSYGYMGRWQFGKPRLWDLGLSIDGWMPKGGKQKRVITKAEFLKDHALQDRIMFVHVKAHLQTVNKKYARFEGKIINGIEVTESGMVAGLHLKGEGSEKYPGLKQFLLSGQSNKDGYGTEITEYILKFGGYELELPTDLPNPKPRPVEIIKEK